MTSLYEDFNYKLVIDSDMREIKRIKKERETETITSVALTSKTAVL